jgi:Cft2 family RNA processing exonuclease
MDARNLLLASKIGEERIGEERVHIEYTEEGICLPEINLWLDPRADRCARAWISHAHSDHAYGRHCTIIGTPLTLELYRMRWPEDHELPQTFTPLGPGESLEVEGARLTCYPAGHILGAAQLLVEFQGERVLYTGDIKLQEPLCGQRTQPVACDRLIIESTFGLPIYHFLSREEARERILHFARESFDEGTVPVFLGYPLGRGQEIANVLCEAGIATAIHGAIARYLPVYERAGFHFRGAVPYDNRATPGRALLVPPEFRRQIEASGKKYRVAYVSGWAALDNARARSGAEELIPYSDHGGFEELMELVRHSDARQVDVVHGYTEPFARILRLHGIKADAPERATGRPTVGEVE